MDTLRIFSGIDLLQEESSLGGKKLCCGMSVVLPVIIIQARFSCERSCGYSVRSFVRLVRATTGS